MRFVFSLTGGVLLLAVLGCSSSESKAGNGGTAGDGGGTSSGVISCDWVEGPNNCWQAAVDEAYSNCSVPQSGEGYFGDQYLSCAYPNGDSDIYGSNGRALDAAGNGHDDFYVEATRKGSACFTFEAPATGSKPSPEVWSLTTKSGTVEITSSNNGMAIKCADGSTFSAYDFDYLALLSCPMKQYPNGVSAVPLPGYVFSESQFTFFPGSQASTGDPLTRCTCAPPEWDGGGLPPPAPGCPSF